jgi:hypothetical protein
MNGSQVKPIGSDLPAYVTAFREAMRVLRVPAPPSFELDPPTGVSFAPPQTPSPVDGASPVKSKEQATVDVAV